VKFSSKARGAVVWSALLVAGFAAGTAVAVTGAAGASDTVSGAVADVVPGVDAGHGGHPDEELLTGTTADRVAAAAMAEYPTATIERVETDSEGIYEAHIVTAGGQPVIVQVDRNFTVTGTQTGFGHGGHDFDDGSST